MAAYPEEGDWSSQPTYEGLKPSGRAPPSAPLQRSQPTYEGLKPGLSRLAARPDCRSQPTYEGLKLWSSVQVSTSYMVPSLPMRD